jgi:hypothetical protein
VAAAGTLGVAALTGLLTQAGAVDTSGVRWIHHGLYAASIATCTLAALVHVAAPGRRAGVMVPSLLALAVLGRTRGGTAGHGVVATLAVAGAAADLARTR